MLINELLTPMDNWVWSHQKASENLCRTLLSIASPWDKNSIPHWLSEGSKGHCARPETGQVILTPHHSLLLLCWSLSGGHWHETYRQAGEFPFIGRHHHWEIWSRQVAYPQQHFWHLHCRLGTLQCCVRWPQPFLPLRRHFLGDKPALL